jgi:hypothetical protein
MGLCLLTLFVVTGYFWNEAKAMGLSKSLTVLFAVLDFGSDNVYFFFTPFTSANLEVAFFVFLFLPTILFIVTELPYTIGPSLWRQYKRRLHRRFMNNGSLAMMAFGICEAILWPVTLFVVLLAFINFKLSAFPTMCALMAGNGKKNAAATPEEASQGIRLFNKTVLYEIMLETIPVLILSTLNEMGMGDGSLSATYMASAACSGVAIMNSLYPLVFWQLHALHLGFNTSHGLTVDYHHNWVCSKCGHSNRGSALRCENVLAEEAAAVNIRSGGPSDVESTRALDGPASLVPERSGSVQKVAMDMVVGGIQNVVVSAQDNMQESIKDIKEGVNNGIRTMSMQANGTCAHLRPEFTPPALQHGTRSVHPDASS